MRSEKARKENTYRLVAKISKKYSSHAKRFCIDEQTSHFKHAKFNARKIYCSRSFVIASAQVEIPGSSDVCKVFKKLY